MTNIEFNLPYFPGFYNSFISIDGYFEDYVGDDENTGLITQEQYDSINVTASHHNIAKAWTEAFKEQCKDVLSGFGVEIDFVKVDSPKFYNYRNDWCVCKATFDKDQLISKLSAVKEYLDMEVYTSRSGFASFYSNDPEVWMTEYLHRIDKDNVIFEGFLSAIIAVVYEHGSIESIVNDQIFENIEYI